MTFLTNFITQAAGGPTRVENAKIALVQFHISPPKTDIENNVIISDYAQVCMIFVHKQAAVH